MVTGPVEQSWRWSFAFNLQIESMKFNTTQSRSTNNVHGQETVDIDCVRSGCQPTRKEGQTGRKRTNVWSEDNSMLHSSTAFSMFETWRKNVTSGNEMMERLAHHDERET
jgi:hypothetical protein